MLLLCKSKVHTPEEVELQQQLLGIAQKCLPRPIEEDGLSMDFYVTFWRLSLQDGESRGACNGCVRDRRQLVGQLSFLVDAQRPAS